MKGIIVGFVLVLLVVGQIQSGLSFPSTVPAFLWSSQRHESLSNGMDKAVDYRTISQKDLAKSVLSEGGWSKFMCSGENLQQAVDIAIVFLGSKLRSSDISRDEDADRLLPNALEVSILRSNFSRAFPYVAGSEEKETMESSLLSGFTETCTNGLRKNNIAILGSCSLEGGDFTKLADMESVHDYVNERVGSRQNGQTDLIVLCNGGSYSSEKLDQTQSEALNFVNLITYMEGSGASYSVLYASDPYRLAPYPSYRELDRFLAEGAGNGSLNATYCDGVCKIKSSLLEGFLVAIVLLIILISGLCCMMGIDTPTRFETPQES